VQERGRLLDTVGHGQRGENVIEIVSVKRAGRGVGLGWVAVIPLESLKNGALRVSLQGFPVERKSVT